MMILWYRITNAIAVAGKRLQQVELRTRVFIIFNSETETSGLMIIHPEKVLDCLSTYLDNYFNIMIGLYN
jgi:hypothetical protein